MFEIEINTTKICVSNERKPLIIFTVQTFKEVNTVPETKARQKICI